MMPTRPSLVRAARLLVLLAGLTSCRTTESLEPPNEPRLVAAEALPITLSGSLRGWNESASSFGNKTKFRLGSLLARLFPAHDGRTFLSPGGGRLETNWNGRTHTWEATYTLALSLQHNGVPSPIVAEGRGQSSSNPRAAERDALEDSVLDLYTQIAALLASLGG